MLIAMMIIVVILIKLVIVIIIVIIIAMIIIVMIIIVVIVIIGRKGNVTDTLQSRNFLLLAVNLVPHFLCGTQNNPKLVT
jgi:hypothetical protein